MKSNTDFMGPITMQLGPIYSDVARGGARGPGPPLAICLAPSGKIQTELAEVVILYYLALWKFRLVQWQIPANPKGFAISISFNGSGL